jgi:hypothetical protein
MSFLINPFIYAVDATDTTPWYAAGWNNRLKLTIDSTKVSGTQTSFPVFVSLADLPSDFHTNVKAAGADIRITTADGTTEVPREIVSYVASASTGEMHFKADISSSADTSFYIYYGNSGATDYAVTATFGRNNVWKTEYAGVFHSNSLTTNYEGTQANLTNQNTVLTSAGKLGSTSMDFTSGNTNKSLYVNNALGVQRGNQSFGGWFNFYSFGDTTIRQIIQKGWDAGAPGTNNQWSIVLYYYNVSGVEKMRLQAFGNGAFAEYNHSISTGTWNHIYGTFNGTSGVLKIYHNGSFVASGTTSLTNTANQTNLFIIGAYGARGTSVPNDNYARMQADEVRVIGEELTENWLLTEYNNQNNASTFYSPSSQQSITSVISLASLGAYYRFNGNSIDSSGNGLNGTNTGTPTYSPGKFGDAIDLNGTSQFVTVNDSAFLEGSSGDISVFGWIKITDFASDANQHLASKWDGSSTGWRLVARAGDILLTLGSSNIGRGSGVPTGSWIHIGFTRSGSTVRVYQNGSQVGIDATNSANLANSENMTIGKRNNGADGYVKGQIDDVSVWQRALTASEISDLYNSTNPLIS